VNDFDSRLEALEQQLAAHAEAGLAPGLTEPDPDTDERWEAAQVWAHMAEFVGYWHGQIEGVVAAYGGEPVPFGRTKSDEGRIAAIEAGRREPLGVLEIRATDSLHSLRDYLAGLSPTDLRAVGRHQTLGEMDVEAIVRRFIVGHLEEHLAQLDSLDE
jgi:hypothetical protein